MLTILQEDALKEIINIGIGKAAGTLAEMIETHITLYIPEIKVVSSEKLERELSSIGNKMVSYVRLDFVGDFTGKALMLFPKESASKLVAVITNEDVDSPELDTLKIGTLSEVGNIVVNAIMGSISNQLSQKFVYSLPYYEEDFTQNAINEFLFSNNLTIIIAETNFRIKKYEIEGKFILLFEVESFKHLLMELNKLTAI